MESLLSAAAAATDSDDDAVVSRIFFRNFTASENSVLDQFVDEYYILNNDNDFSHSCSPHAARATCHMPLYFSAPITPPFIFYSGLKTTNLPIYRLLLVSTGLGGSVRRWSRSIYSLK